MLESIWERGIHVYKNYIGLEGGVKRGVYFRKPAVAQSYVRTCFASTCPNPRSSKEDRSYSHRAQDRGALESEYKVISKVCCNLKKKEAENNRNFVT